MDEKKLLIARGLATGAENLPLLLTGAGAEIVVERVVISGAARVAARAVGRAAEVAGSRAAGVVGKVAEGVAGKLGRLGILKADNLVDFHLETGNVANIGAPNAANALRLKTTLRLQEAGILDHAGQLTATAIDRSVVVMSDGSVFNNQSVIDTLTKNGSHISDWQKLSTESVAMRTGQRIQVHFYRNKITGEVDYIHPDFKVKNPVKIFPKGRPQQEPTITPPYNRY